MNNVGKFVGISANLSGKLYGINYAEIAKNLIVQNGALEPRSGAVYLSTGSATGYGGFGIKPIKLGNVKYAAVVTVGPYNSNTGIGIIRGRTKWG